MACQEKHPDWNYIHQGRKQQSVLAKELHQKAGVPEGLYGLSEVATYQQVSGKVTNIFARLTTLDRLAQWMPLGC